jgi:hypothetical protein
MTSLPLRPVEYSGQLTLEEWLGGYKYHSRSYRRPLFDQALLYAWVTALIVLLTRTQGFNQILTIAALTGIVGSLALHGRRVKARLSDGFHHSATLSATFQTRIDEDGLTSKGEYFHDRRPWKVLTAWKETREVFLVYESREAFRIIPKRVLQSPDDVATLRDWLSSKLGPSEAFLDLSLGAGQ